MGLGLASSETPIAPKTHKATEGFLEKSKRQGMGYFSIGKESLVLRLLRVVVVPDSHRSFGRN